MTNIRRALEAAGAGGETQALWAWGRNTSGELGLGNKTTYSSPKQVGNVGDWSATDFFNISSAYKHTLAIKPDGTLWAWGDGNDGKLGNGSQADVSSPVQIGALTDWSVVSAGSNHSLAIKTDGTFWAWGQGAQGRLGLGNTTSYSSPVQVGALTNWASMSAGPLGAANHCFGIKTDGTLWAWGYNTNGKLGLGNTTNYSSPKQVGALTTWIDITAGRYFKLAVTDG